RTFNKVDLPAPFLPMIPTTSPFGISKETSFSAQMQSGSPLPFTTPRKRRNGAVTVSVSESRSVRYRSRFPIRYCFATFSARIAISLISYLLALEVHSVYYQLHHWKLPTAFSEVGAELK